MESLHTYLFEAETPLTTNDLASKFVSYRIQAELAALNKLRVGDTRAYLPKEKYAPGDTAVFPALDWRKGRITAVRSDFNPGAVKIDGRSFARGLLIDINEDQSNLAEAVLDMAQGEPQPTSALLKDVELPSGVNPKLAEFSLNYALQDDPRFDEVGPAGEVLWCLRRLEPDYVREVPLWLRYEKIEHDRSALDDSMKHLESQLDDELTPVEEMDLHGNISSHNITLIYPHLRAGTLPISPRARKLFPTAYESPRVRFTLVDGKTKQRIPAWVVREHGYVFGLREWYKTHQLIPGSLVQLRRGEKPGEVIVEVKAQ